MLLSPCEIYEPVNRYIYLNGYYFGNTIYEIKVPRANVLFQTIEGAGEKEVLIRICADKIKKIT